MSLTGGYADGQSMKDGLIKKGIKVDVIKEASSHDILASMTSVTWPVPASCWAYFQGHGKPGQYITADDLSDDDTRKGLGPDDICRILGLMNPSIWRMFATDFCYSGNYFSLRFVLTLEGNEAKWAETPEWSTHKCAEPSRAHDTPTIHFAGSTGAELVYEGGKSGGFFTNALVSALEQTLTLPNQLLAIRACVNNQLGKAGKASNQFLPSTAQTPQIFSSVELSLDDPQVLAKFQQRRNNILHDKGMPTVIEWNHHGDACPFHP